MPVIEEAAMESSASMYASHYQQAKKSLKQSQSLHSVRKSQLKQSKKPIAPFPPTPPKVYQVDPINFRDLVQKLTGADDDSIDESLSRLHQAAPPPLHILDRQPQPAATSMFNSALYREMVPDQKSTGFLELNLLSPSSCSYFPLLSPGTLSTLD